jgi:proteasome lid subunit RPN8/RPN11
MIKRAILPKHLLKQLVEHANNNRPKETVALIAGQEQEGKIYCSKVFTTRNIDESTVSFTADPHSLLEIYQEIDQQDLELVAIFHTHPAPAKPSEVDKHYMKTNPVVWLISNTNYPEKPQAYILNESNEIVEISLEITTRL